MTNRLTENEVSLRRILDAKLDHLEQRVSEIESRLVPRASGNKVSVIVGIVDHLTGRKEQIPMTCERELLFGAKNIRGVAADVESLFRAAREKVLGVS